MISPVLTRRKWMLHAQDQHIVVVRGTQERFEHPLMKALIWALYLPWYPSSTIEQRIDDRYRPDVVAFGPPQPFAQPQPVFWGEAGQVGRDKIRALLRRYPETHFVIAKWATRLDNLAAFIEEILPDYAREAPFDLISFPQHSADYVDAKGQIHIAHADVSWRRLGPASSHASGNNMLD